MLLDSNILIYASKPCSLQEKAIDLALHPKACISAITYLEVLGYHKLNDIEKRLIEGMLDHIEILQISKSIIHLATLIRQEKSMSLGDAIIAATALKHDTEIVTANSKDFIHLNNIRIIDLQN